MMTLVLIFFFVAATLVAYVIGYWGRTSATVTSSNHETVAKETACRAGKDITDRGGLLEDSVHSLCPRLTVTKSSCLGLLTT